eukprot:2770593-Amphidinium_carterae.1
MMLARAKLKYSGAWTLLVFVWEVVALFGAYIPSLLIPAVVIIALHLLLFGPSYQMLKQSAADDYVVCVPVGSAKVIVTAIS